ncbi:TVP38/TMEM64 family protein [Kitasatospora sp. NPDC002040]|uniref:TVP38/TMEM64 family protein n=1 Tax=Kitasatospora sp. NPDC002040 TaxID=3154661 RepID=UPI00332D1BB4
MSVVSRVVGSPWFRLGALLAVLGAAAGSLLLWSPTELLREGVPAPVFLLVYALATLAFVPKPALNGAAGLVLGTALGVPVAVAATTLGALLAFWLGRALGRDAVRPLLRGKVASALDRRLSEQGFRSMLLVRVIPGVPFQAANYAAAFSGVRTLPYTAATALGVAPGTAAYVIAGANADDPGSPAFLISAALIVIMCLFTLVAGWRAWRRRPSATASPAPSPTTSPAPSPGRGNAPDDPSNSLSVVGPVRQDDCP